MSTHAPGQFCWFECATRDVAKAKSFYAELFGWGSTDVPMPGMDHAKYTLFTYEGKQVGGMYSMSDLGDCMKDVPSHWMSYVFTPDVDAVAAQAVGAGGKLCNPPMDVPGVGRMCTIADPQGAAISIFHPTGDSGPQHMGGAPGGFCWSELVTTDAVAGRQFYSHLLPWGTSEMKMGGPIPYVMWTVGGKPVGGMMQMDEPMAAAKVPSHWMPYVSVTDPDAVATTASRLGGAVVVPPMDIPGVGRFTIIQDLSGAHVAAIRL